VGRVALIDSREVAEVSAVILTEGPQRHARKIYDISAALGTRVGHRAR
jgi:hypothetical protein